MIIWQKKEYGFYFKLPSYLKLEETVEFVQLAKADISKFNSSFSVYVDLRDIQILPPACRTVIFSLARFCKVNGMKSSVVVYSHEITASQIIMMSKKVNIFDNERYINSAKVSNWEEQAVNWLTDGIEPENQPHLKEQIISK